MTPNLQNSVQQWPGALVARPQLIADAYAMELRDAWFSAEREHQANVEAGRYPAPDVPRYAALNGVAVIPVSGILLNRYNFLGEGSPYTSYPALTREVERAADDPSIRAIALAISSPGGTADGILGPALAIRAARDRKPVTAIVGSIAASGGYWIAAQAHEIVLQDDFSSVGSIGVYTMHMDVSKLLERVGIDISVISSGAHKVDGHPFAPLPADVRKDIQDEVDDLRVMFAREVAAGRSALTVELALATEAKVFSAFSPRTQGRPAIEAKLADRMGSVSDVVASFNRGRNPGRIEGTTGMTDVTKEEHDRAVAAARTEGAKEASTRIAAIMTSDEGKANQQLASHLAHNTSMSVDDAKATLKAAGPAAAAPSTETNAQGGEGKNQTQTYEQRKAQAGGLGYVDTGAATPQAKASAGWSKAVAAANKGLGPGARN